MDIFIESSLYLYKNSYTTPLPIKEARLTGSPLLYSTSLSMAFSTALDSALVSMLPQELKQKICSFFTIILKIFYLDDVKEQQILFHKFHLFTETNLHTCINILSTCLVYCEFFCVINMLTFLGM